MAFLLLVTNQAFEGFFSIRIMSQSFLPDLVLKKGFIVDQKMIDFGPPLHL